MTMTKLPQHERPRERLLSVGEEALTDAELLAIILGKGTKGKSVLHLSQDLMSEYGSLKALLSSSIFKLMQTKGIGEAKAIQLKALFALSKRAHAPQFVMRYPITDPFHAYLYVREKFKNEVQEQILVVLRDARGAAYHCRHLAIGRINCVGIDPKELLSYAITNSAVSMIFCHNHPTGNVTPSKSDIELTDRLGKAAALMGIRLDDHLIISQLDYTSFYNEKLIRNRNIY